MSSSLTFSTHKFFRQRLIFSTLLGKPLKIFNIRSNDLNPGLRDYEASFLRLLEKVTNGSSVEISFTGTSIIYIPGTLSGGKVNHDCGLSKSIGWFLEFLIILAPFFKSPLRLTLSGITSNNNDISVDSLRTVTLPHLSLFGISDGLQLKIVKRGSPPLGGGLIQFDCPNLRSIKPLVFSEKGKIKRIRGIAHSTRVSPQLSNRLVDASRSILNTFIPDIYLYTDVYKGEDAGKSPGYGLTLVAESTSGALHSSEAFSTPATTPEDVAKKATYNLLNNLSIGGSIDQSHQWLALIFMVLSSEDVSKCRFGTLSPHTIQFMRDIKTFFGVTFKITKLNESDDDQDYECLLSCIGTGYTGQKKVA